jgi:2,4-dienoyl-CoA reductase (NADPH2)
MPEAVNVYLAEAIRAEVKDFGVPVITAGRIPTAELAESILREGKADLIGIARPLMADPDWPKKYMEGREKEILRCVYCNECLVRDRNLQPVECVVREKKAK